MARPKKSGGGSGASVKRILGAVALVAGLGYLAISQANKILSRALDVAFEDNDIEIERGGAWLEWDGDIHADNVTLHVGDDGAQSVRFRRAHLETPGWVWFATTAFHPKRRPASLSRVHLTLTDATFDTTEATYFTHGPMLSLDTGSLYVAKGCLRHNSFRHAQLAGLGLSPGSLSLDIDIRAEDGKVLVTTVIDHPGVSRMRYQRTERLQAIDNALLVDNFTNMLQLDALDTLVLAEQWQVEDRGFVQARNAFCAKEDGIDVARFNQRHLDSVLREIAIDGVGVDAATRARYATFARDGGTLAGEVRYREPVNRVDLLYDTGVEMSAANIDATLAVGAQGGPVMIETFTPRPLAGYDWTETPLYPLLAHERELEAPAAPAAASPRTDAQRGVYKVFADPLAAKAAADAQAAMDAAAAQAAAAELAATPAPESTPAPPATPMATAADVVAPSAPAASPTAPVASLPAPAPSVPPSRPVAPVARELVWSDLAGYKGQRMRVWTRQSPARNVELLDVGSGQIRVKALLGGGHAQYSISRQNFARAKLLD